MKQKLALICTLIHRPQLLLLDEPTTGVDPLSRREFWEILHEIVKEGVTIVISTPYMDEAEWCTRIGLMFKGKFISCDTPKNLKSGMSGVVAEIVPKKDKAQLDAALQGLEGITDTQILGNKYHVVLRNEVDAAVLKQKVGPIAAFREIPASIEDVFVSRIKQ
jgi:ABC-2 type transport system ATP-binding protein